MEKNRYWTTSYPAKFLVPVLRAPKDVSVPSPSSEGMSKNENLVGLAFLAEKQMSGKFLTTNYSELFNFLIRCWSMQNICISLAINFKGNKKRKTCLMIFFCRNFWRSAKNNPNVCVRILIIFLSYGPVFL